MKSLATRARNYYLIQGLKALGLIVGLEALLCLEFAFLGSYDGDKVFDYTISMITIIGCYFSILMNFMFSMYGPNWYDSMVLSMGGRRIDIFWGEIIKQLILGIGNSLVFLIVCLIFNRQNFIPMVLVSIFLSLFAGALGFVIGHKIKKAGKPFVIIIATVCGVAGAMFSFKVSTGTMDIGLTNAISVICVVASLILFVVLEFVGYSLNQKSMVA